MSTKQITATEVAELLRRNAGLDLAAVDLREEAGFAELGADSLAVLGLLTTLETRHGVALPESAIGAQSLGEFLDLVNSALRKAA